MEGEWHTLHRIEEVSNLISLLREYKTNTITRNGVQQSRWFTLSLLHLENFNLFRGVFAWSNIYSAALFLRKSSGFNPGGDTRKLFGGR